MDEALQTFEQMVADDPVNFDCEDIDIRENVSIFHVCLLINLCASLISNLSMCMMMCVFVYMYFYVGIKKHVYGNSVLVTCTLTCVHKTVKILLRSVNNY